MKQINSHYSEKTANISGSICRALEHYDGTQFIEPFFEGETVGWVRDVLVSQEKKKCQILIVSPDFPNTWLTMSFAELKRFGMGVSAIGSPIYVVILRKRWQKLGNLPYRVYNCCYCEDYLKDYDPPEFMKGD